MPKNCRNLLVSYIWGNEIIYDPGFKVFRKSASEKTPTSRKYILHQTKYDSAITQEWEKDNFIPRSCNLIDSNWLCNRWYAFYQFLQEQQGFYDLVCLSDSRDVLFQADPFIGIGDEILSGEFILFGDEGMKHKESEWNLIDQFKYQQCLGSWKCEFKDWHVKNAGFLIGTLNKLKEFCLLMWQATVRPTGSSDQAPFNYLVNNVLLWDESIISKHPLSHSLILTGEGTKYPILCDKIDYNGCIFNKQNEKSWSVVHQWDRTIYREDILARFAH